MAERHQPNAPMDENIYLEFRRFSDWYFFTKMLSVEVTADFIAELKLPIESALYPQVMRLARACLEVEFFPYRDHLSHPDYT
jgi:hypothetical protein